MYLKRTELQGFKSFAARTVFAFEPGITAVVGPNGSGKSNVVDAVRWALGEQSARLVRARKIEDLIFSGGAKRPPAGFAEVSLVLDNEEHWLPVDFSEVVVTRRAARDGEVEYLVNRSRVRLRDVVDLFQRARLGQNSYAIIGQGLVDQVLAMRPLERRGLIEEAADVYRHRVRLQEAEQKLAATRENLARVALVLAEIEPRVAQLERQAQRARHYRSIVDELATTLQEWYTARWRATQDALTAARAVYDQRNEEFTQARNLLATAERQRGQLQAAADTARRELAQVASELAGLDERLATARRRRDAARDRAAQLERRLAEIEGERERLSADLVALEQQETPPAPDTELRSAEQELRMLPAREQELRRQRQQVAEAARAATAARDAAQGALARTQRELEEGRATATRHQRQAEERLHSRRRLIRELAAVARDVRGVSEEERDTVARVTSLSERLSFEERAVAQSRKELEQASLAATEAERAYQRALGEMEALEREMESGQAVPPGVRFLSETGARRGGPFDTFVDLVGRLLRVPSQYERAIEVALGEHASAVVAEEAGDALEALQHLARAGAGEATVWPLDGLRYVHPVRLQTEAGIFGVASDLVRCDKRYRPLVETLLGRVVVVQDATAARSVVSRGLGAAVTLDGMLFRPQGSITGGRRPGADGLLALERRRAEMIATVEQLSSGATASRALAEEAEARVRAGADAVTQIGAQLEQARRRRGELAERIARTRARMAPARAELHVLRARDAEQADSPVEIAALRKAVVERERMLVEADAARAHAGDALAAAERAHREARDTLEAGESRLAALRSQAETLRRVREAHDAALARVRASATQREQERTQVERLLAEARREADTAEDSSKADQQRLAALRGRREELRKKLAEMEQQGAAAAEGAEAARQRSFTCERACLEAETRLERCAEDAAQLERELADEGLVVLPGKGGRVQPRGAAPPASARAGAAEGLPGIPPIAGAADVGADELGERVRTLRARLRALGSVNLQALQEYEQERERGEFLRKQSDDLHAAEAQLVSAAGELRRLMAEGFQKTFDAVNAGFSRAFQTFFGGGDARLELTEDGPEQGVEILARPPGKRVQSLALLSGGERSMTAVALLFALLEHNPAPFCLLDEVDAALDEANVARFGQGLRKLAERTQFVVITHNRRTLEVADRIYGVTMGAEGVSALLSLKLEDVPAE